MKFPKQCPICKTKEGLGVDLEGRVFCVECGWVSE